MGETGPCAMGETGLCAMGEMGLCAMGETGLCAMGETGLCAMGAMGLCAMGETGRGSDGVGGTPGRLAPTHNVLSSRVRSSRPRAPIDSAAMCQALRSNSSPRSARACWAAARPASQARSPSL